MKTRPDYITDEHLVFLDDLRETGVTNMYGAAPYVSGALGLDNKTSRDIVSYWMKTFGDNTR